MLSASRRPRTRAATPRNPERTRDLLLRAAFQKVYKSGYQGTDLDTILAEAGVTKGALYHHFGSKEALGYAIVDEILANLTREKWLQPLEGAEDPIDALIAIVRSTSLASDDVICGCPLNNLSQEMSPLDEGFRKRIARVFGDWRDGLVAALRGGRKRGLVRAEADPGDTATFFIALYEGYMSLAKNAQDPRLLESGKKMMVRYLESLRAPTGRKRSTGSA